MKNKSFLILLLAVFLLTATACGQKKGQPNETKPGNVDKVDKKIDSKLFGTNLIKNGAAEMGDGRDWTNPNGNLRTFRYDGGWYDDWKVTPPAHGDSYFYANVSKNLPVAVFTQKLDVSKIGTEIDAGQVVYNLDGWFGMRGGAGGRLIVEFYGANDTPIKGAKEDADATEKITEENHPDDVTMVGKTRAGQVPGGTRSIKVTLEFSLFRNDVSDDGVPAMADNLSLVLTNKGDK